MIRPFSPPIYGGHLLDGDRARTARIFGLVRRDRQCRALLNQLVRFGYRMRFPWLGGNGHYKSHGVGVSGEDYGGAFMSAHADGVFTADFAMSPRFGLGQNSFYFIHELMHFEQDMLGLLFSPLQRRHHQGVDLDQESRWRVVSFCESLAMVESIRAADRLRRSGTAIVWEGALSSLDWGRAAQVYAQHSAGGDGSKASTSLLDYWHQHSAKRHYQRQALAMAPPEERPTLEVEYGQLASMLPRIDRWAYAMEYYGGNGTAEPPAFDHGSAAYLWRQRQPT